MGWDSHAARIRLVEAALRPCGLTVAIYTWRTTAEERAEADVRVAVARAAGTLCVVIQIGVAIR